MKTLWILPDQLSPTNAALALGVRRSDRVLLIESRSQGHFLRYHKKRLTLVFAAMRHFAETLRQEGWQVDYYPFEDTPDYAAGLKNHLAQFPGTRIFLAEPNDWPTTEVVRKLSSKFPLEAVPTVQFLLPRADFAQWASGKKHLVMENHYRRMRERTGYLMRDGQPEGGQWNLDHENRKTFRDWTKDGRPAPPPRQVFPPDALTREVMTAVVQEFSDHPGATDGFDYPVTRADALAALDDFVTYRLGRFGDYEDLIVEGQPSFFHSVLTPPLNLGLITPAECVETSIAAYRSGKVPLNSVEGFVRQIIGWREFINGVYWQRMPDYLEVNELGATRQLPDFFYTGKTDLRCLSETIRQVLDTGYNHHIQRLMVLGNFLLLTGIRPSEALRWFLEMYVDAWDWVMAANVLGMVLHADGGYMATKPYAAGSGYISKMSNHCENCRYKPSVKTGPEACPFNYLYWNFFDRHEARFEKNPRVAMPIRTWQKKSPTEQKAVRESAETFLNSLG